MIKNKFYWILKVVLSFAIPIGILLLTTNLQTPMQFKKNDSSGLDLREGEILFANNCVGCHSIKSGEGDKYGPNLSKIGAIAGQRKEGLNAAQYILESIINPAAFQAPGAKGAMPQGLANALLESQVKNLVAYLTTLGGAVNAKEINALKVSVAERKDVQLAPLEKESIVAGEKNFFSQKACMACHAPSSAPVMNQIAPGPAEIAVLAREDIEKVLRNESLWIDSKNRNYAPHSFETTYSIIHLVKENANQSKLMGLTKEGRVDLITDSRLSKMAQSKNKQVLHNLRLSQPLSEEDIVNLIDFFKALER